MYRITSRRAFDVLRKKQKKKEHLTGDGAVVDRGDDGVMQRSQAAIALRRLEQVYHSMHATKRFAHILHHFYGLTTRECAEILGLTESNVDTLICRATRMLKRAMEMKP